MHDLSEFKMHRQSWNRSDNYPSDKEAFRASITLSRRPEAFVAFRVTGLFVVCIMTVWIAGCSTFNFGGRFDLGRRIPWVNDDAVAQQPNRITPLWTQTVLNQAGKKSIRGFGGRIMFHSKESDKPVKVEGTLTVYAFDETNKKTSTPERKFVFPADQFEKHYSESKLGHSYSIWLPWDEVGGVPRRISLLARFEPAEGSMIMSETSTQTLPGIPVEEYDDSGESPSQLNESIIEQASYVTSGKKKPLIVDQNSRATESDTINLPPSFNKRLNSATSNDPEPVDQGLKQTGDSVQSDPKTSAAKPKSEDPFESELVNEPKSPQETLKERQKVLADRFGRTKFQARKAPAAQQDPSDPVK